MQYFRVKVSRRVGSAGLYNLSIQRLMKKKESTASGLAPQDNWTTCGEILACNARDAMCLCMALEHPRLPLKPGEENTYWAEKTKDLPPEEKNPTQRGEVPPPADTDPRMIYAARGF